MMLFGQNISADEASKWGFVENVVEQEALDQAVEDWIQQLEMAAPDAVRSQKALTRMWEEEPSLDKRIQKSVDTFANAFSTKGADGLSTPERAMAEFAKRKAEKGRGGSKL
jgi:enoyl-CoA hydratase